jgi:hypothetical protein
MVFIRNLVVASIGLATGLLNGCNVISPDLLEGQQDAALPIDSGDPIDSAPQEDAADDAPEGIDAGTDAYVPFVGNLVENHDLETNTSGWTTNGGSFTIALSTAQAHGGLSSLYASGRTSNWQGPSVILLPVIRQGRHYATTVYARMELGTDTLHVSTRQSCVENGQSFNQNTSQPAAAATDTDWVQATNSFTVVSEEDCTLIDFIVYVESTGTGSFYVDDIEILEIFP